MFRQISEKQVANFSFFIVFSLSLAICFLSWNNLLLLFCPIGEINKGGFFNE